MNVVEKYVRFAEPLTEAPRTFHFYMAYMMLSMVVEKRAFYTGAGSFPMSPLMWMIFLGPSSMARKSTILNIATRHILADVFLDQDFIYPSSGSHEAFIEHIEKNPSGMVVHSEFANMMTWMAKDYNAGLIGLLTDLYDQPLQQTRIVGTRDKKRTYLIKNPFINISTASTISWLNKHITENMILGGFLPRFMLIMDKQDGKTIPITPPYDNSLRLDIIEDLQRIKAMEFGEMRYNEAASKGFCAWYTDIVVNRIRKGMPENLVSFFFRRISDVHKFAMLNCVLRSAREIGGRRTGQLMNEEDLDGAIACIENIMNYTEEVVTNKITFTPYENNRQKLMDIITSLSNGNGGAHHSMVLKRAKMSARDMGQVIDSLIAEETISQETRPSVAGRPLVLYKIKQEVKVNGV